MMLSIWNVVSTMELNFLSSFCEIYYTLAIIFVTSISQTPTYSSVSLRHSSY